MYRILSVLLIATGITLIISTRTDLFASFTDLIITSLMILGFILLCSLTFFKKAK